MKPALRVVFIHITYFAVTTALFLLLLKLNAFGNLVLFYRGLVILVLIAILGSMVLLYATPQQLASSFTCKDIIMATVLFFCLNLAFFITIPVTIDRSISVHLLESVMYESEPMTKEEIEQRFIEQYFEQNDAIAKRLHEQLVTGNVTKIDDKYTLTPQGERTVTAFQVFETMILPETTIQTQ
jgi:hypothetical protein